MAGTDLIRTGAYELGDPALADAVETVQQELLTAPADDAPTRRTAPVADDADDAEAEDFRKRFGYPISAKRLPAGRYRLTGVDAWNQVDPTAPDGVQMRRRGDLVDLDEHEASRLLHIKAIDDPDAPPSTFMPLAEPAGQMQRLLEEMNAQIARVRDGRADALPAHERRLRALQSQADEITRQVAKVEQDIAAAKRARKTSDDEIARSLGETFAGTRDRLQASIAELTEAAS